MGLPGEFRMNPRVFGVIAASSASAYELLTREPAVPGEDRQELLRQIAFEDPRPPRHIDPTIPFDLETIVLKALAKAPEERYATAQDVADDLRRFLDGKPVQARRPSLAQIVSKWARRNRTLVMTGAASLVVLVIGLTFVSVVAVLVWYSTPKMPRAHNASVQRRRKEQ